jgi:hypothetical protein
VVDVGVAEDDRVDVLGAKWKVLVAIARLRPSALEQAAVQQDGAAVGVEPVHRPSDGAGSAMEGHGRIGGWTCHVAIVGGRAEAARRSGRSVHGKVAQLVAV